ncbi:MAG: hydrolase [Psychroserpens sp.]|uniref:hydrolase n=1 Tax=Psychroserpens sp. TaxID=2020870 RepID=UPI0030016CF5
MNTVKLTFAFILALTMNVFAQNPNNDPSLAAKSLLDADDHVLIMIDHEGQMALSVQSIDIQTLRNNVGLVAGTSKLFEVSTIITTVAERSFSGPVFPEIREYYSDETKYIDRTTMNSWEDKRIVEAVKKTGKKRIVLAGLWTEICVTLPALSALEDGYEVYVITDASGGVSKEAHDMAVARMIQVGIVPITSMQYLLELHRDWARAGKYVEVTNLAKRYGGAYGLGIDYISTMREWDKEGGDKKH